jgi:hypothetical protein
VTRSIDGIGWSWAVKMPQQVEDSGAAIFMPDWQGAAQHVFHIEHLVKPMLHFAPERDIIGRNSKLSFTIGCACRLPVL